MRKVALLLLLVAGIGWAEMVDDSSVGKRVVWEPPRAVPQVIEGELLETPNQRRRRLGESFAAPEPVVGEALETPNQRRARLGLSVDDELPELEAHETIALNPTK
jgi:hypothetical protein